MSLDLTQNDIVEITKTAIESNLIDLDYRLANKGEPFNKFRARQIALFMKTLADELTEE